MITKGIWTAAFIAVCAGSFASNAMAQAQGGLGKAEQAVCQRGDDIMVRALKANNAGVPIDGIMQTVKTVMGEMGCAAPPRTCSVVTRALRQYVPTSKDAQLAAQFKTVATLYRDLTCDLNTLSAMTKAACEIKADVLTARIVAREPFHRQVEAIADLQILNCPLHPILDAAEKALNSTAAEGRVK